MLTYVESASEGRKGQENMKKLQEFERQCRLIEGFIGAIRRNRQDFTPSIFVCIFLLEFNDTRSKKGNSLCFTKFRRSYLP